MAELQQKDSGGKGKGKQKKVTLRVDFTPMVDMNMLLITFFMLATTMSKPQIIPMYFNGFFFILLSPFLALYSTAFSSQINHLKSLFVFAATSKDGIYG